MATADGALSTLLASADPALRYKATLALAGGKPPAAAVRQLQQEIRASPRAQGLLAGRDESGVIPLRPYSKWDGAHWVLTQLADIGYPPGDETLIPLRDQVLHWLLGRAHQKSIRTVNGRVRRCASQEGNALWYLLKLGLAGDEARPRVNELARRLVEWQWPDGGWNCDLRPEASHSSFHESLIPLRGLALHGRLAGDEASLAAASNAAGLFLERRLYRRRSDGRVIDEAFTRPCYPPYWHYDILIGLKVMAEAGFIGDPRCQETLDLLAAKRLPDGGWPAEGQYYRTRLLDASGRRVSGRSLVDWGGSAKGQMNPWVTAEAFFVLRAAGRDVE
jgi:hypothetical protein